LREPATSAKMVISLIMIDEPRIPEGRYLTCPDHCILN
jgi:hypothetical protein